MKLISLLLVMITLVTFWRVRECEFINCDDPIYVSENPHIRDGLTWEGIEWAFGADLFFNSPNADYWQPVTFLSRMVDIQLFGLDPSMHHLMNLMFHVLNTLLLFHVLRRMTGETERSAWVAAFFAAHPLQVEAVAWVTQRKDMLSGFFWMLTICAYVRYVSVSSGLSRWSRYGVVVLMFGLGLMSKPMGVTLPFVLLLLDFWPLNRAGFHWKDRGKWMGLALEKSPLLLFSIMSYGITLLSPDMRFYRASVGMEIGNILISYVTYLAKTIFPHHLAIFYPRPAGPLPVEQLAGSLLILALISFWVVRWAGRRPFCFVGWCWFVGTLVPVIGLNDLGDRFTYLPMVGIFIMIVWGISLSPVRRISAGVVLTIFIIASVFQLRHWKNSLALFEHALEVDADNYPSHNNLGEAYLRQGKFDQARAHFIRALQINPDYALAHCNLGYALVQKNRIHEAIGHFHRALKIDPHLSAAHCNLGVALVQQGKMGEAIRHYLESLKINPDDPEAHNNLGNALLRLERTRESIRCYARALRIKPDYAEAHYNLGNALVLEDRMKEAIEHYLQAIRIKPDYALAHYNLGVCLLQQGHGKKGARPAPNRRPFDPKDP